MAQPAQLTKVALIYKEDSLLDRAKVAAFESLMTHSGIDYRLFRGFVQLMDAEYIPDCVLVLYAQEPKLGPYPTYGIIDTNMSFLFSRKRFIRNILTYDGCLSLSPFARNMIADLYFSTRKQGGEVGVFGLFPPTTAQTKVPNFPQAKLAYMLGAGEDAPMLYPLFKSLDIKDQSALCSMDDHTSGAYRWLTHHSLSYKAEDILTAYNEAGIGLDLNSCNDVNKNISTRLAYILASGAVAITNRSEYLYSIFGDSILYLSNQDNAAYCIEKVEHYVNWVREHPDEARSKAEQARETYNRHFGAQTLLDNLRCFHAKTLQKQGYLCPDSSEDAQLPTVSYFMRTGGDPKYIRRTLDCLAAQSYPNLQVVFVLYKPLLSLQDLVTHYEGRLRFKVVEDFGGLRSTGIVSGMKSIETEYFGMIDDDDLLHPNHVTSLVRTLRYHQNLDWRGNVRLAYSGAYYASDTMKFAEDAEWHDEYLEPFARRRMVEHFRFYEVEKMASHQWYMMSNSWLAHRSLIDAELLNDPKTHTHEDIYFELQFALRTEFAFSVEMTVVHCFHGNNSTIVDVDHNEVDVFRHMLRLHYRTFPRARMYRTYLHGLQEGITPISVPQGKAPLYLQHRFEIPRQTLKRGIGLVRIFMRYAQSHGLKQALRRTLWWVYRHI